MDSFDKQSAVVFLIVFVVFVFLTQYAGVAAGQDSPLPTPTAYATPTRSFIPLLPPPTPSATPVLLPKRVLEPLQRTCLPIVMQAEVRP